MAMVPDMHKALSDYLRAETGERIVAHPPDSTDESWAMVTQLAASQNDSSDHLVGFYFQIDCYAGKGDTGSGHGLPEANLLARIIRAKLNAFNGKREYTVGGEPEVAVVGRVHTNGDAVLPDTSFEPARDRRILTAEVWGHIV